MKKENKITGNLRSERLIAVWHAMSRHRDKRKVWVMSDFFGIGHISRAYLETLVRIKLIERVQVEYSASPGLRKIITGYRVSPLVIFQKYKSNMHNSKRTKIKY